MKSFTLLLLLITVSVGLSAQHKKTGSSTKKIATNIQKSTTASAYPGLPDSLFQKLSQCNGVDIILFYKGKSMEFNDKNAQAPVSFIGKEIPTDIAGFKQIGLFTYKINGSVFLDCDILLNETQTVAIMRFKDQTKQLFYREMNEEGFKILTQWIK